MIVREVKLKLNSTQDKVLNQWLWHLTVVYNWAIRRRELNLERKIHEGWISSLEFQNLLAGTSRKLNISSHTIQAILVQADTAWERCFKKISGKPRFKGKRNKLTSIPFPDVIPPPENNKFKIAKSFLGTLNYFKQDLPQGKIKCGRIIKRASGWYLSLVIDTIAHKFKVKETQEIIGIDPGFSTLLTLSNGEKIQNPRELRKREKKLGQAQRGHNKKLVPRLHERQANIRKDRNHKISRRLLENYQTIFYSKDSFNKLAQRDKPKYNPKTKQLERKRGFGKSVREAGLGQLFGMMTYKAQLLADRKVIPVESVNSTKCCSTCGNLSGPSGKNDLAVRYWECEVCGTHHDRDINAAMNILNTGLGCSLENFGNKMSEN